MLKIKDLLIGKLLILINCEQYFQKGVSLFLEESYQSAIEVFSLIFEEGNQFGQDCCNYLVECYERLDEQRSAAKWMEKQFSFSQNAELSYSISERYYQIEDYDRQLQWRLRTIQINPSYLKCHLRAAQILQNNQKSNESIKILQKALQLFPQIDQILIQKGETCESIYQFPKAANCYKTLIQRNPQNAAFYLAYGRNIRKKMDYDKKYNEACDYLQIGLKLAVQNVDQFYCQLGLIDLRHFRQKFFEYLKKALEINPQNHVAHIGIVEGYSCIQQYLDGINYILNYLQNYPNCQETKAWLALFYEKTGQIDLCDKILSDLEKKTSNKRQIYLIIGKIYQTKEYLSETRAYYLKHVQTGSFIYQKWNSIYQLANIECQYGNHQKSLEYLQMLRQGGLYDNRFDKIWAFNYFYLNRLQQSNTIIQQIKSRLDHQDKRNIPYFFEIIYCAKKYLQCIEYYHKQIIPLLETTNSYMKLKCMLYFLDSSISLNMDNNQIRQLYHKVTKILQPYKVTQDSLEFLNIFMAISIYLKDYSTSQTLFDLFQKYYASKNLKKSKCFRAYRRQLILSKEKVRMEKQQAATPA